MQTPSLRGKRPPGLTNWERAEIPRRAPRGEGALIFQIAEARALYERSRDRIRHDIEELKEFYVFADDAVDQFLIDHPALPGVLREAIQALKSSFGSDRVFRLEVSIDEDDSKMLYGVALWGDAVRAAAQALDNFAESWWLNHMTPNTTDLAFIYKISR
jgi:hypothetical protein